MTSEEGARVDFTRLRNERRVRLFDAMAADGIDVLVLGRPGNVHYASGARQLWTAGARPFGPACLVVRQTGQIHLLSVWDEGVPPEIPHENLFGLSWNPANLIGSLSRIPGLSAAGRVGTDGLTPGFADLLGVTSPKAVIVDGNPAIHRARSVKTPDELACITTATAVAEAALAAMTAALCPGVTERQLVGVFAECIARLGAPAPASEGVVCRTPREGVVRLRQVATDRPVGPGELVVLNPGALYAGYEGGLGRTWLAGRSAPTRAQRSLAARCRGGLEAVLDACRAGNTGADLRRAWESAGAELPPVPLVYGVGIGVEPPVVAPGIGDDAVLVAGSVVAVQGWVGEEGVGGFLERELVAVGNAAPEVISRYGRGPAASAPAG